MEESQRKYLETMYFKYSEKLLRVALHLTGSEDTAYELIQNTFITAIGKGKREGRPLRAASVVYEMHI